MHHKGDDEGRAKSTAIRIPMPPPQTNVRPQSRVLQYEETQEGYLGYGGAQRTMHSAETNKLIDAEIKGLVEGGLKRATDILKSKIDQLHLLAQALLEYETLTGDEIRQLLADGKLDRPDAPSGEPLPAALEGTSVPRIGRRLTGEVAA